MYSDLVVCEAGGRGLFCVAMSLAMGCFAESQTINGDESGGADTAAVMTATDDGGEDVGSTSNGGAEADPDSSGEGSAGATGSPGTMGADTEGGVDTGTDTDSPKRPPCSVVFLNFDGVTLTPGEDDATLNTSSIFFSELFDVPLMPFGPGAPEVADLVRAHLDPFNVCVVTDRPDGGDYDMVVVTSTPSPVKGSLAVSSVSDCGNVNKRDVSVVFDSAPAIDIAAAASSRVGFHVGLESGTDPADIMGPAGNSDALFLDRCTPLLNTAMPSCAPQHAANCTPGNQNSFRELHDALGPAPP